MDLEKLDGELERNPIASAASFVAADELAGESRLRHPLIASDSVDVVVSNGVLNLVEPKSKRRLFAEIFRGLKKGGRAVIFGIVSDEDVRSICSMILNGGAAAFPGRRPRKDFGRHFPTPAATAFKSSNAASGRSAPSGH